MPAKSKGNVRCASIPFLINFVLMLQFLLSYIKKEELFSPSEKILLAVSGGIDSVVMCELFHKANLNFGIAHCNFQLRGVESDEDELFVEKLAEKYAVPFHRVSFDTSVHAKKNKLSIQVAARQLRYNWFEEVRKQFTYKFIATAHHRGDSIETFFINLIRGTGISGLHGILPKQGKIIRPLLFTNKNEIELFSKKNKLKHREDSSNSSDKYVRNKIRHQVIPVLKELNPNLEETINNDIQHLRDVEIIFKKDIENKRIKIVKQEKKHLTISIQKLKKLFPCSIYLFEFLKPYNFNSTVVNEIIESLDAESGKQFFSETHRLIKDREILILESRDKNQDARTKIIDPGKKFIVKKNQKNLIINDFELSFSSEIQNPKSRIIKSPSIACLDFEKLEFPLEIRKWEKGDFFYPLGMKGKKLVSDFFIDKKLSLSQKENIWLLTSKGKTVWIIGQRIDDRFKITDKTLKIYFVKIVK